MAFECFLENIPRTKETPFRDFWSRCNASRQHTPTLAYHRPRFAPPQAAKMAEPSEKFDERPSSIDSNHSLESTPSIEFTPINTPVALSRPQSHARNTSFRRSLSRTRSNNGYGCDEDRNSAEEGEVADVEAGGQSEKDPFEVRWDGGDSDPMCPRSMSMARKWLIVIIVSASSLCV